MNSPSEQLKNMICKSENEVQDWAPLCPPLDSINFVEWIYEVVFLLERPVCSLYFSTKAVVALALAKNITDSDHFAILNS